MIGYAVCGSFCTIAASLETLEKLTKEYDVLPIISENVRRFDTRFGRSADIVARCEKLCGREAVCDIVSAEPLGPARPLDAMVIAPCTGNTLAKLASGITDTVVTMAAKAHMRTARPLLIALASNDAMSANLANLSRMMMRKGVYFVPMEQDDPQSKPFSLVARTELIPEALEKARMGVQMRPVFLEKQRY
ncbi:MAG: dipicolinate synthase subunit B [Clostridia bacterium]|nr:dipicolinate synthase subunit B [Clostridia bacterium]